VADASLPLDRIRLPPDFVIEHAARAQRAGRPDTERPTDVPDAPDGSLLVSCDTAGAIYGIRYCG
jgi:glucose/arabinose dehydrogenase